MEQFPTTQKSERVPNKEIEQKYLLGSEGDARRLEDKIQKVFPKTELAGGYSETSYYFPKISKQKAKQLLELIDRQDRGSSALVAQVDQVPEDMPIALRLRRRKNREDKSFILSFKASEDPLHDIERIEIETGDIDENFLEGFSGQGVEPESIWHSNRRVYQVDEDTKIDVQNVTGYGWTAEIESTSVEKVESIADVLGLKPLNKNMLGAMYKQYGKKWQDYYGGEGADGYFSDGDWEEIEAESGEQTVRNKF